MVFPVVMYGCEGWTVKKAERRRIDAFELSCRRRLLRDPWTARRSNQSILKEMGPGSSLEGMMQKLKLQYFGNLMQRVDSLEKTLMLGGIGGRRRRCLGASRASPAPAPEGCMRSDFTSWSAWKIPRTEGYSPSSREKLDVTEHAHTHTRIHTQNFKHLLSVQIGRNFQIILTTNCEINRQCLRTESRLVLYSRIQGPRCVHISKTRLCCQLL